jgi:GTPase SAR1 family protein
MSSPFRIALVGHSNVGKTSLVAALARDASLEVREEAGTTRAHYETILSIDGTPVLSFVDTPGFESADEINRVLDRLSGGSDGLDGRASIEAFLLDGATDEAFRPEKEALRGVLKSDVIVYVVDVTRPPGGQQRQELRLLRRAGVPLMAVLNLLFDGDDRDAWREMLRREQVFNIVPLDAMEFPERQEAAFYDEIAKLRPEREDDVQRVRRLRSARATAAGDEAARRIAEGFVDMMAFRLVRDFATRDEALAARAGANEEFKQRLRDRERRVFDQIGSMYGFPETGVRGDMLDVAGASGDFVADIFDPEALRRYGASMLTSVAAGAITGSVLDGVGAMGFGTALGAVGGGVLGHFVGRRITVDVDAKGTLSIPSLPAVRYAPVLVNRAVTVARMFASRSHARRGDISLTEDGTGVGAATLTKLARLAARCRRNRRWSAMDPEPDRGAQRARTIDDLTDVVRPLLRLDP